jgi:hypothetical protein
VILRLIALWRRIKPRLACGIGCHYLDIVEVAKHGRAQCARCNHWISFK